MITTDTGAKKIENSDNWRQIFDAHNDSVDAEDKIVPEMAPIVNGNKSTVGAAIGEYVLVRNSSITGITDGAYTAAKAIPANTTIDSTYLTAVGTGGALNALNSNIIGKLDSVTITTGTFTCYPTSSTVTIESNYSGTLPTVGFVFFTPYQFASDFGMLSFFWEGGKLKCKGQATYGATKVRWFKFTPAS